MKRSYCLFLDIVGYSNYVNQGTSPTKDNYLFKKFHRIFDKASLDIRFKSKLDQKLGGPIDTYPWQFKIFSDNIVIGCPLDQLHHCDDEDYFAFLISDIQSFQFNLALSGFFIKGGWCINTLYIDDFIVYGKGLIEAFNLESKAEYPYILLSNDLKQLITKKHLGYYAKKTAPQYYELLLDNKKRMFVNYMAIILDCESVPWDLINKHKDIIEERIDQFQSNSKILTIYKWVASYHNYFCKTFIRECPRRYFVRYRYRHQFSRIQ
ncbi:MAG: hypothetical protein OEV79_07975 [candidate division WOR-3 bacterium]|nr:hypothetical protein [candidate division WOR-3 bacterium]